MTCTITNTASAPKLTLSKHVDNTGGGTANASAWMLAAAGSGGISAAAGSPATGTDASVGPNNVTAGVQYTLGESGGPASGYTSTGIWSCVGGGTFVSPNKITLALGDNVTCTITNSASAPKLTLLKTVANGNTGGTATTASFQGKVDGNPVAWGVAVPLSAGSHTASETTLSTYMASNWGGACGPDGSITLALGQSATCTITNTAIPATITVNKVLVPSSGNTDTFNLRIDGTGYVSGSQSTSGVGDQGTTGAINVALGTNTVSEAAVSGLLSNYIVTYSGACDSTGHVAVTQLNTNYTCTITNTEGAFVKVIKTLAGGSLTLADSFRFEIISGGSVSSAGTVVSGGGPVTVSGSNGGMVTFTAAIDPTKTYQFCELTVPSGWNTTITSLTGWFYLNLNNSLINDTPCVPIGAGTPHLLSPGQFLTIGSVTGSVSIDNTRPPGGASRTIGYWKNWSSCTGGGQTASLDANLPQQVGTLILGSPPISTPKQACIEAVDILNKSTITGTKEASDPSYNMAAQLLGALLNVAHGTAFSCPAVNNAINAGQSLLLAISFDGTKSYAKIMTPDQIAQANSLQVALNAYNNNNFAFCPSSPTPPAIVSANSVTFASGKLGTFTVLATGFPTPTLAEIGGLPMGITFNAATGALSGTTSTKGTYHITFTAANGVGPTASQSFTLTVQ